MTDPMKVPDHDAAHEHKGPSTPQERELRNPASSNLPAGEVDHGKRPANEVADSSGSDDDSFGDDDFGDDDDSE